MDPHTEAITKLVLCVLAIAVLVYRHRFAKGLKPEGAGQLLGLMAIIAGLAYTNFGEFNGWPPIHSREMYHYFLGAKYFPELGYDGLYMASVEAQRESGSKYQIQDFIRDLPSNRVRPMTELRPHAAEVRSRFTDERWRRFVADHDYFLVSTYPVINFFRYDHGYNPPPNWTFAGQLVSRWLTAGEASLQGIAMLDFLLLAVSFAAIYRTFGARVACLGLLIFGLGAPWRFDWTGGAFLRNDWFALLALGLCALKRERFLAAGMLIGYSASLRVFPAAFLVGPAVLAVGEAVRRKPIRWFLRLSAGVAMSLFLAFFLGCLVGNGPSAWPEFFRNIRQHHQSASPNSVGLKSVVLMDAAVKARHQADSSLLESIAGWDRRMDRVVENRRPLIVVASMVFVLMVILAMRNRTVVEVSAMGVALVFGIMAPSCYYFVFLVFVPLVDNGWRPTAAVLATSAVVFFLRLEPRIYETIYGVTSWVLLAVFVAWMAPDAVRGFWSLIPRSGQVRG